MLDWMVDIGVATAVLPDNVAGAGYFDRAIVALVTDQNVAILKQFSAVWTIQLFGTVADHAGGAIVPDDVFVLVHLNNPLVRLIGDEYVAQGSQVLCTGALSSSKPAPVTPKRPVLPDNVARRVH